ncbi:MAG: sigma 54-interacting transcriptional regulator [Acidobacteria bacterium]|nr:sigma 54-interacting transcriptional regulator [Acidobacteriota bacterium]
MGARVPHFILVYSHPELGEQRFELRNDGTYRIGSRSSNDIVIAQDDVSRHHAVLKVRAGGFHVTDLGSKNGTFVNGTRVSASEVQCGDQIQVSSATLVLVEVSSGTFAIAPEIRPTPRIERKQGEREDTVQYKSEATVEDLVELLEIAARTMQGRSLTLLLRWVCDRFRLDGVMVLALDRKDVALVSSAGDMGSLVSDVSALARRLGPLDRREDLDRPTVRQVESGGEHLLVANVGPRHLLVIRHSGDPPAVADTRAVIAAVDAALHRDESASGSKPESGTQSTPSESGALEMILGSSSAIQACKRLATEYARQDEPIMITGESGTGKELFARAVHALSRRHRATFVGVNCAAIPADLIEAELFGVSAGAATGVGARPGKFQSASGGTLLLDEIGDLPTVLQGKLLRVLEAGELYRVGDDTPITCDVRVISATNRNLEQDVQAGRFRSDLYYRLHVLHLHVPPLRERRQDIPPLVNCFLESAARRVGRRVSGVTVRALDALTAYAWPGNVRELRSELVRAVASVADGAVIDVTSLSPAVRGAQPQPAAAGALDELEGLPLEEARQLLERWLIGRALEATDGNQTRAAERLGLSRAGLFKKMKRLGM